MKIFFFKKEAIQKEHKLRKTHKFTQKIIFIKMVFC